MTLACPQCGGAVRPDEEDAFATCGFCQARLILEAKGAFRHEMLPPALSEREAAERLARWLKRRETAGRLSQVSGHLVFVPFWVLATPAGRRLEPAAAVLLGDAPFALPAGDLKRFDEALAGDAELLQASQSLESALAAAAAAGYSVVAADARLVHIPFWQLVYDAGGAPHGAWVDAVSGQVLAFRAPASLDRRLDAQLAAILALLLLGILAGGRLAAASGALQVAGMLLLAAAGPAAFALARSLLERSERS